MLIPDNDDELEASFTASGTKSLNMKLYKLDNAVQAQCEVIMGILDRLDIIEKSLKEKE